MSDIEIKKLRDNHQSGSVEILLKAAEILKISNNRETIEKVRASHPDKASLYNLCQIVKESHNPRCDIENLLNSVLLAPLIIDKKLSSLVQENAKILTYSRSSTVKSSLIELKRLGKFFEVLASESRPGYEDRSLTCDCDLISSTKRFD